MQFHVAQNGEKTGPFEREEVLRRLVAGELKGSDLGWHEGLADWEPLSKLIPPPTPNPAALPVFGPTTTPGAAPIVPAGSSGMALASMICGVHHADANDVACPLGTQCLCRAYISPAAKDIVEL